MSTFDYGNTRLRARLSRLLAQETLEELTRADNMDGFLSLLIKTAYKPSVEKALTHSSGIQTVHTCLKLESEKVFSDYHKFYTDTAWDKIGLIFSFNDLQNIHTIVRGILGDVAQPEIQDLLTRSGNISFNILRELSTSRNFSDLITKMIAFHIPYTDILLKNQTLLPSLQGAQIELMLEKNFFQNIIEENAKILDQTLPLKEYFSIHADQENIMCALRAAKNPEIITSNHLDIKDCFINAGTISRSMLISISEEKNVEKAIERLIGTPYYVCLQAALTEYSRTGLLTEFEERLRKMLLKRAAEYPIEDPLGVGVPIGFLVRKTNEMQNLWWIAKGVQLGFDSADIIEHLEVL
ncbi:MAG: V-type ATPase subunit [Chloroflexi bacterium]|nr:V-type ATPase subunit [Chloroflexota bacterium]